MKALSLSLIILAAPIILHAQDELLSLLEEEQPTPSEAVSATFKSTRIINGHSIETRKAGTLTFLISHRFGTLNSGSYNFWGLDNSNIRLALEYAIFDRFEVGLGRNSFEKTYDSYLKYRLLEQKTGAGSPVSVVAFSSLAIKTLKRFDGVDVSLTDKMASTYQLLIARKFTSNLSLQVAPALVHYNLIEATETDNNVVAIGLGGRYKLSKRWSINAEYFPQLSDKGDQYFNTLALGVDIQTGGHVFQLHITNARAMIEKGFIGENRFDFFDNEIHFGFNISRVFQLKRERVE